MTPATTLSIDPKFRCCCGQCHVTTGTKIICYICLSVIVFTVILTAFIRPSAFSWFRIIADILFASVFIMSLYGIKSERPNWLIPFFVFTGFGVAFAIVFMLIPVFYLMFNPEQVYRFVPKKTTWGDEIEYTMEELMEPVPIKIILSRALIEFLAIILHIWFLFVFYRCFQFLKAKNETQSTPENKFYTNPVATSFVALEPYSINP